jgi:xanthine dehydrogenase accessory factor
MIFNVLRQMIAAEQPVALATIVAGERLGAKLLVQPEADALGTLGDGQLDAAVASDALVLLDNERSETRDYHTAAGTTSVLIEVYPPPHHLIIVGAVHTAIPLTTCAKQLGFRVTVIDPRAAFATPERFPDADELVIEWPDEALPKLRMDRSTYVAVLTHDPKLDDPAVRVALSYPVRYVGALGSPKTQAARKQTLREMGVSEADIGKIYGPIGLPIGGKTPAEIAVSIVAEMIAVKRGRVAAFRPSVTT